MRDGFERKVALVTGAASGIGRATALAFAQRGSRVALADVSVPRAQETLQREQPRRPGNAREEEVAALEQHHDR